MYSAGVSERGYLCGEYYMYSAGVSERGYLCGEHCMYSAGVSECVENTLCTVPGLAREAICVVNTLCMYS